MLPRIQQSSSSGGPVVRRRLELRRRPLGRRRGESRVLSQSGTVLDRRQSSRHWHNRRAACEPTMGHMDREATDVDDRFFDLSIDMLTIAHFSGYFKRLNAAWERTLGFTRQELQSMPMFDFVHPDDRERTREQNRKVRAGEQALGFENRYRCKDGSYKWLL